MTMAETLCQKLLHRLTQAILVSFNLLSNERSSTSVDCGRIHLAIVLVNIWRHFEPSYPSRFAPTREISGDSGLESAIYQVLDAALQNLKLLSDVSLQACLCDRGVGSCIWHWALASFEASL